uniref:NADH dehydrogenase subunit 3 n=1 Tax=Nilaparvata lugens TaxID=108931 RepID=A0A075B922_NILLU|nr:NADH dehydrogenase subunit 3 [Nilaparvata lugens]AEP27271.1 NADH dehydrogenase subunit 3 [Nilaparvata lugens]AEP27284.1 NADH dehydrogenase subunit 3 [Nilaparvata lugens]AGE94075.1 NADH dehydrogenase subunit 3 [Nilaparvata lugens]UVW80475.1 NADH dehydrogenase subunit 3 [Leptocorisa oratoria]
MLPIWVWILKLFLITYFIFNPLLYNCYYFYYIWYWNSYYTSNFHLYKINNSKKMIYIKYINLYINSMWSLPRMNKRNYWMI